MGKAKLKRRVELAESAAKHWRDWAKNREEHYEIAKREADQARAWAECCEREIERLREENRLWVPLKAEALGIDGDDARFLPGGDEGDCRGLAT